MKTKSFLAVILAWSVLATATSLGGERPVLVTLIQLIANPERFDGKTVSVIGFLALGEHPEFIGQRPLLYAHREDARNLLPISVWVAPSDQMRNDQEKIDQMYVKLTGVFHAGQTPVGASWGPGTISEVQSCTFWSNPNRPIGDNEAAKGHKYK